MCFLGEFGVEERAVKDALCFGLNQSRQQPGGPALAAAARIVAGIGKDDCRFGRIGRGLQCHFRRVVDRHQCSLKAFADGPAVFGDLTRQGPGLGFVVTGGDDDGDAVLWRVGKCETAQNGDVEDGAGHLTHAALAVLDHVGVRSLGGQQGHARRRQRQADESRLRLGAG